MFDLRFSDAILDFGVRGSNVCGTVFLGSGLGWECDRVYLSSSLLVCGHHGRTVRLNAKYAEAVH